MFHAAEFWGFDSVNKQFVAFVFDNFGGARRFTSAGWSGDTLTWLGEGAKTNPASVERFVYKREGAREFVVSWEVKKGTIDWTIGDRLVCKK